jgi:hypothetical protein
MQIPNRAIMLRCLVGFMEMVDQVLMFLTVVIRTTDSNIKANSLRDLHRADMLEQDIKDSKGGGNIMMT